MQETTSSATDSLRAGNRVVAGGIAAIVLILLGAGGAVYLLGTVFYKLKSLPFSRAIWHFHVLAAAATHYAAVVLIAAR